MLDPIVNQVINGGAGAVTGNKSTEGADGVNNVMNAIGGIMGLVQKALPIVGAILGGI